MSQRLIRLAIFGGVLVALILVVGLTRPFAQPPSRTPTSSAPQLAPRSIDGLMVTLEKTNPSLAAVAIDNFIAARPQSGLQSAGLVFEAPAEAAITRFLAIVPLDGDVAEIGPIRSVRPYFIDWAIELSAPLIHVGGSPAAFRRIISERVRAVDEWRHEKYIWRSRQRPMPHNTYTSTENLRDVFTVKDWKEPEFIPWLFKDGAPVEARGSVIALGVPHHDPGYRVRWRYVKPGNSYLREQAGSPHLLADETSIRAANVAIMFTDIKILDQIGRREIRTVGEGRAMVARDGDIIEGKWKRPALEDRTRFYDKNGAEIFFNRGLTWITVVPRDTTIAVER